LISLEKEPYYQKLLQPKQHIFSFGEILHRGDENKSTVIHTKVFSGKMAQSHQILKNYLLKLSDLDT
jgi:hypothetical protein